MWEIELLKRVLASHLHFQDVRAKSLIPVRDNKGNYKAEISAFPEGPFQTGNQECPGLLIFVL